MKIDSSMFLVKICMFKHKFQQTLILHSSSLFIFHKGISWKSWKALKREVFRTQIQNPDSGFKKSGTRITLVRQGWQKSVFLLLIFLNQPTVFLKAFWVVRRFRFFPFFYLNKIYLINTRRNLTQDSYFKSALKCIWSRNQKYGWRIQIELTSKIRILLI